ncbi:hypothetical protein H4R26_004825 [Coemansia thaxteri]|uniref:EamA domain-containing protein n=1 Tax=Coemansia thaxteri TaxID=2663907 RepID=A0A9W8EHS8_9FUNG|nr:hypothetical protein H4R26_004825 [Coemansia thaxteri]KAJ2482863.1 hypothetical protein EV174_003097 [Coemansia sp. RSA 2320]
MEPTQAAAASASRRTIGLVLLLCVVFIWVASSFLVSSLFGELEFNRPFFITYLNTGTFSLYLVGACASWAWKRRPSSRPAPRKRSRSDDATTSGDDRDAESPLLTAANSEALSLVDNTPMLPALVYPELQQARLTVKETVILGVSFCGLWFAANVTQNASLAYTTVASSSILCSTSGLFTLVIGAVAGVERFNSMRLAAVLASILGVYSIVQYGYDKANDVQMPLSWLGDMLALLSAALYGCYTTLLKRRIGDESRLDTPLFFGAVGLANILLLWPGFILLHYSGIETFQLPRSGSMWLMIVVNAMIGTFVSDYLWLLAMLMTSPLVVTLGLSLTIPLSMAGDIIFKGLQVSTPYYIGALLILFAFVAANL